MNLLSHSIAQGPVNRLMASNATGSFELNRYHGGIEMAPIALHLYVRADKALRKKIFDFIGSRFIHGFEFTGCPDNSAPMEIAHFLIDFILHVDVHLAAFVQAYGAWVYALLFLIIFVETGVVVMPFLPGDSLLFVVGALCGVGLMNLSLAVGLLIAAAILGNQSNYALGRYFGPKVFQWESSRFFNKAAFNQAHAFYERYGGVTLVAARFMPFARTFAPFVAGVAQMDRRKFMFYDVAGAVLWVGGVTLAGYLFGNIPWVKLHLDKIIWGAIIGPGLLVMWGAWRARRQALQSAA
jgi:membrane-associated protein